MENHFNMATNKCTSFLYVSATESYATGPAASPMLIFFFLVLLAVDFLAHLALSVHFSVMTVFYQASFGHSAIANC